MTTKENSFAKAARGRLQENCSTDFHQPSALCACSKLYYSPSKLLKYTQQMNYITHQNQSQENIRKKAKKLNIFYNFFKKGIDKSTSPWYNNQALAKRSSKRCGGVAQLARATGSYPVGHGFKSNLRYQWPVGQAAKTPPFHGGNGSSILPRVTKRNKSELFRKSKLVRICFLLLNSQINAISENGTVIVNQSVDSLQKFLKSHLNFSTSIEYICRKVIVSREYFSINTQKIEAFL